MTFRTSAMTGIHGARTVADGSDPSRWVTPTGCCPSSLPSKSAPIVCKSDQPTGAVQPPAARKCIPPAHHPRSPFFHQEHQSDLARSPSMWEECLVLAFDPSQATPRHKLQQFHPGQSVLGHQHTGASSQLRVDGTFGIMYRGPGTRLHGFEDKPLVHAMLSST